MLPNVLIRTAVAMLLGWSAAGPVWSEDSGLPGPAVGSSVEALVAALGDEDGDVRWAARTELARRLRTRDDATDITDALIDGLKTNALLIAHRAGNLLEERIDRLQDLAGNPRAEDSRRASRELEHLMARIGGVVAEGKIFASRSAAEVAETGIEAYADALEEGRRRVRRKGVRGLSEVASQYVDLLADTGLRMRARRLALDLLEELVEVVQVALRDPDERTRLAGLRVARELAEELAWALEEVGPRSWVRDLIEQVHDLLSDPAPEVRRAAARAVSSLPKG